jgi:parvulin-like peptidyl-prolyl isomerase
MRRFVPPLLLFVLVASACSALGQAPAATVNGSEISTEAIDGEIVAIRGNEQYMQALEQSYGVPTEGSGGEGTFDAAFVAQYLALRVYHEIVADDLDARGIEIEDETISDVRLGLEENIDAALGDGTFASFPPAYRDLIVRQQAIVATAEQAIRDEIGDEPEQFFEDNPEEFTEVCISHILVGLQGGASPAEAQADALALRERIEEGEDFATIATNESDDPGAASEAGSLGCGTRSSLQFDPTFEEAAFALDEGELSQPVQTQFGSHLILVTERTAQRFADVQAQVPVLMRQLAEERVNEYFTDVVCEGNVTVNPRYGTWASESCDGAVRTIPRIEPPEGPTLPADEDEGFQFEL